MFISTVLDMSDLITDVKTGNFKSVEGPSFFSFFSFFFFFYGHTGGIWRFPG